METNHSSSKDFALSEGGPFNRLLVKMGLHDSPIKLAAISLCITGLPLIIITAIEGTLYSGTPMPFVKDFAMHARVLLGIPILIIIRFAIDSRVIEVSTYLSEALMSPAEQQLTLETAFRRAKKLTNSTVAEILLLLTVIVATISFVKGNLFSGLQGSTSSWMVSTNGTIHSMSVAGYWAVIISIPIFQFLLLRWLWRYFVWALLLFRLSKAKLNLLPTHPDKSGGLGIIILAQKSFNLIFVAGSVVLSGQFVAQLIQQPDSFDSIRGEGIGYIVICLVIMLIPLLFFMRKLFNTKNKGLLHLSKLGAALSNKFEKEWVNDLPIDKRIADKEIDPSMMIDYASMYDSLQQLRPIPVTLRDVVGMVVSLFVPFLPILFVHFSVAELLKKIVGMLV